MKIQLVPTSILAMALMFLGVALFYPAPKEVTHAHPQEDAMAGMSHGKVLNDAVDGSKHPELIKDKDAYRLFLLAASAPDDSQFNRQSTMFSSLDLTDSQFSQVHDIMSNFKTLSDAAVNSYNQRATADSQAGRIPDLKSFISQRDAIVAETVTQLNTVFGQEQTSKFHALIQIEKRNMKVGAGDSSQDN
jgi:hypothetical protein